MRPPSYYSSLASAGISTSDSKYGNLSRSSFSSPTSSTYATRSHLPYVPSSMLVAHCISGASSSSSKPSNHYSASTGGYSISSYSRPAPQSTRYQPSYSSSSYVNPTSASISSYSSRTPSLSSSYLSSSYSSSRSGSRNNYLSATSHVPGSTRTSYRPSSSASTYTYRPIRLRDRPLLTQISRQINPTTSSTNNRLQPELSKPSLNKDPSDTKPADDSEETWSSDVARNISRNKYLIKFREFDKRKDSSVSPVPPLSDSNQPALVECIKESIEKPTEKVEEPRTDPLLVVVETKEKEVVAEPKQPEPIEEQTAILKQIEEQPKMKVDLPKVEANDLPEQLNDELTKKQTEEQVVAKVSQRTRKATPDKKQARERRNIRLKVKTSNAIATEETNKQQSDENKTNEAPPTKVKRTPPDSPVVSVKPPKANGTGKKLGSKKVSKVELKEEKSALKEIQQQQQQEKQPTPVVVKELDQQVVKDEPMPNKRIRFREYNLDDFDFLSVLGHGGWGFVILAELKGHDACFAVKCIKKITIVEDDDFDSIMIERKMLTLGNLHPFICKLFCTFETEGYLFFAMEYCAGGDLMFHVQKEGKFTEARCRFYAAEIICAIRFLHNRHIIYRDLKLDNILLDSLGHVRLVDFGMCQCRTYREEMLPSNFCGTPEYISPEIIKGVPYNHSVDWWSFGVLLYEMAVGKMPFRGNDENELLWNVCYEQIHYPMFLSKDLTSLLQLLLEREPTKRMGMASCKAGDIYDQPWFRGVDWPAVESLRVKPPFVPEVNSKRDVQNFDSDFTESRAELSPVDEETLQRIDQSQFQKFPYTNPDIDIFDSV